MIPGMIQAASAPSGAHSAAMTSGAHDKGFISILKTSINDATQAANADKVSSAQNATVSDTKGNDPSKDNADTRTKANDRTEQDPAEALRQLVLQMAAAAHQVVNQPAAADQSSREGQQSGEEQQAVRPDLTPDLSALAKEISQLSSSAQASSGSAAATQGSNFPALLALNQDPADKVDLKLSDKIPAGSKDALLNALKGLSQDNGINSVVPPSADSAKADAQLQSFGHSVKDLVSKTAESDEDIFSQFKVEMQSNTAAGETGDKNNYRAASALSAQGMQTASVHEQSPIQETVAANKLTSLDAVISKALDSGQRNLVIRIDPPDLGSMHIKLSLDNGVLKADVRVDSSSVKDSFNLALPQIKTSLENSGIKISEFHVDVREDQYRNGQERNNQGQQQRQDRETKNGFSDFFA